ncbi:MULTISPECIES: DUF2789 domain-containing protein [Oceanimonas]|uniref:DUF2789 domain-containing protein n=1 Tax=Oceanimonas doudoroffii TaxID=84158 RepID=A0A233RIA3_9GAMM|nr:MULTISPECIES: DUF2789 domain-containing protein [Oceanimonas]NHI00300.1 hypothetical protein [Oceanimonas sp. MB9]OXY83104.1 hypothetical protein B6S08_06295 [Oceanimonas doudoroffii]
MEHIVHPFSELFEQLGLDASHKGIEHFLHNHRLPPEVELVEAPFWSHAQASFLKEGLQEDSDWAEVIDQLNASLR